MTLYSIVHRIYSEFNMLFIRLGFGAIGKGSRIYSPLKINGKSNIFIGSNVTIEYKSWLAAMPLTGSKSVRLEIGNGTVIAQFNHIYATHSIKIGENVLIAGRVYISDNLHGYQDITTPILQQPIKQLSPVEIGDGSWLGEGVCVIGAKIGKGCVIGSNAVVTKDIPDYCVAVGVPARVIKKYNHNTQEWESV